MLWYRASANTRATPATGTRTTSDTEPHTPAHRAQHGAPRAPQPAHRAGISKSSSSTRTVSPPPPTVLETQPKPACSARVERIRVLHRVGLRPPHLTQRRRHPQPERVRFHARAARRCRHAVEFVFLVVVVV